MKCPHCERDLPVSETIETSDADKRDAARWREYAKLRDAATLDDTVVFRITTKRHGKSWGLKALLLEYAKACERIEQLERELDEAQEHAQQADAESDHIRRQLLALSAKLPSLAQMTNAIQHAVNFHSIDANTNTSDIELAHRLAPQVIEHLREYVKVSDGKG